MTKEEQEHYKKLAEYYEKKLKIDREKIINRAVEIVKEAKK